GMRLRGGTAVFVVVPAVTAVQENVGARTQFRAHAASDLPGGGSVRIPHAERPAEDAVTEPPGRGSHERVAVAMGRAKGARWLAGNCHDRVVSLLELGAHPRRAADVELHMVLRVVADLVPQAGRPPG